MALPSLSSVHLTTLTLEVGFGSMTSIGQTPAGLRRIAPVTGGTFAGERLSGVVRGGADWVVNRSDGVMLVDVRLVLETHDQASVYLNYTGRFLAPPEVMNRFRRGAQLAPEDYSLTTVARFECGDERYAWLNDLIAIGRGEQTRTGVIYHIFDVG